MTYSGKTLNEIRLIHGNYGNFIKFQDIKKKKEKKYKEPPYKDLTSSTELEGEDVSEKKLTKSQIKKRDEIADAISDKEMKDRYGDKNVKYAIATNLVKKEETEILDERLRPLVKGSSYLVRKAMKNRAKTPMGSVLATLKPTPKKSQLSQFAMYHGTSSKSADKIIKSGKFKKSIGDVMNPDGTMYTGKRAFATTDPKRAKEYADMTAKYSGGKPEVLAVKVRDSNIMNPSGIPDEYYVKTKHMKPVGRGVKPIKIKKGQVMQNSFNPMEGKTAIESELTIQDWNVDDIKFTEIETIDIIKPKPLKESRSNWKMELDEGIKKKIIKKIAKKIAKQLGKKRPKITGDVGIKNVGQIKPKITGAIKDVKKYTPPDPITVQNIQTKSVINKAKKSLELSKKPVKGTTPVKVDVSKLDIDKYFGPSPKKSIKKKFVTKRPTGTFTDDLPKVKRETLIKPKPGDAEKTEKLIKKYEIGDKIEKKYPGRENVEKKNKLYKRLFPESNWREELGEDFISKLKMKLLNKKEGGTSKPGFPPTKTIEKRVKVIEDWQKVNRNDKTDGLSQKAVDAYKKENPGSNLQTAVTEKNPKGKRAKRRKAFCDRMTGMKKKLTSAKTARDPDSRINKALKRWNC